MASACLSNNRQTDKKMVKDLRGEDDDCHCSGQPLIDEVTEWLDHAESTFDDSSSDKAGLGIRRRKGPAKRDVKRTGSWEKGERELFYDSSGDADTDDEPPSVDEASCETSLANQDEAEVHTKKCDKDESCSSSSFLSFRLQYLIVHVAIMLADGMQGTHLYVLYEGYGYSVASLYCLGFVSGALTSPFIGPIVDKMGRKNSAVAYCILEIMINLLEQYDVLLGLIVSRVVGGITTNLLHSVFEAWLVTEHRKRGFSEERLETIMRDSVVSSNLSAIASGYFAHVLAKHLGAVGPFEGAVGCTFVALFLVFTGWEENFGSTDEVKSVKVYMSEAYSKITSDSRILRIGIIQGLSDGTLQTFVFLWAPALRHFSSSVSSTGFVWGIDQDGEPAYGLIFGAFMACGVLGGLLAPVVRRFVSALVAPKASSDFPAAEKPWGVELLAALTYMVCAMLLLTPVLVNPEKPYSFMAALGAFLCYELLIGLYMPCEGVIRSMYMPNDSICSLMTMLRVIINVIVAAGVFSTNFISFSSAFAAGSVSLVAACMLQLTLIDRDQWSMMARKFGKAIGVTGTHAIKNLPKKKTLAARGPPGRVPSAVSVSASMTSVCSARCSSHDLSDNECS